MEAILLDAAYAPELVEFWCQKYKEAKGELEKIKPRNLLRAQRCNDQVDRVNLAEEHAKLRELIAELQGETVRRKDADTELRNMLARARNDEVDVRKKLELAEKEKQDLVVRIAKAEVERASLSQQVLQFYSQVGALATEADRIRRAAILEMFPPVSFVDPSFESSALLFAEPQLITRALPPELTRTTRIYFLPRPPSCMPLRVPSCGQPGYWFFPSWISAEDAEFELVVEGRPGEWSYLGCYVSAHMEGHQMQLSEWLSLDEQTKLAHCVRVASQNLPSGQTASYPAQLEVKRRYELGEWSVPCYSLRCVGFNMPLYHALCAESTAGVNLNRPESDTDSGIGKRRRSSTDDTRSKKARSSSVNSQSGETHKDKSSNDGLV